MAQTWMDLAKETLPQYANDEDHLAFLLWNHTAFPFVEGDKIREQLLATERLRRGGWSECCLCGAAYRYPGGVLLGGTCMYPEFGCHVMEAAIAKRTGVVARS